MAFPHRGAGHSVLSQVLHTRRQVRLKLHCKVADSNLTTDGAQVTERPHHALIRADLVAAVRQTDHACVATVARVLSLRWRRVKARRRNKNDNLVYNETALFEQKVPKYVFGSMYVESHRSLLASGELCPAIDRKSTMSNVKSKNGLS